MNMNGLPMLIATMWRHSELCRHNNRDSGDGDGDLHDYISDYCEAKYPDSIFLEMANVIEYMYILENDKRVIIVFRGTDGVLAWLNNMRIIPNRIGAHSGFYDLFNYFAPEIKKYLKTVPKSKPIYCTGHSLGGAMAQYAHWYVTTRLSRLSTCVAFGAPVCGNEAFAKEIDECNGLNVRVVNSFDVVPGLDFGIGKHAGLKMQIGSTSKLRRFLPIRILDHHYNQYTKSLCKYFSCYGIEKVLTDTIKRMEAIE